MSQSPLFALPVGVGEIFGVAFTPGQNLGIKWVQAVLGAGNCLLVWRLGQACFGQPTGAVAGLLAACYGPFIYYEGLLAAGVWAIFSMLGGLLLLLRSHSGLAGLLLGAACGMAGQTLLLAFVALYWFANRVGWGRASLALVVGWAVGFLPVVWWSSAWRALLPTLSSLRPEVLYQFWYGGEWTSQTDPYLAVEGSVVAVLLWDRGLALPFGLIGPLALLGIYGVWRVGDRTAEQSLALWGSGAGVAGALLYGGDAAVRIQAMPLLLIMAALALVGWRQMWPDRRALVLPVLGLVLLLVVCNWGDSALRSSGTANEHYRRGMAYEGLAMTANAIREYEGSIATGAAPVAAHIALGSLYKEIGEYARAIGAYRESLRQGVDSSNTREELAEAYLLAERPREAAAEYQLLSGAGSDGDLLLGRLGDARLMAGDASGALAAYDEMVAAHPDSVRVLYHLARLYESEGFKAEALDAYGRLRDHAPWRLEARWRAAALLAERGELEAAEHLLRAVLAMAADNSPALWGLGRMMAVGGRYEEALPIFERLRDMDPQDYRPYFFLSKLYFRLERVAEAERAFAKYQIGKRRAEMVQSVEENVDSVLRQFGEMGE